MLGHTYKLLPMPPELMDVQEEANWGLTFNSRLVIFIDTVNYPPSHVACTLLHEIKHAIWFLMHVQEKDDEERVISALSNGESAVMRANPKLYRWLITQLQK